MCKQIEVGISSDYMGSKSDKSTMSDDHKAHLYKKHNEYKAPAQQKELPKGMTRMKKSSQKFQWPK